MHPATTGSTQARIWREDDVHDQMADTDGSAPRVAARRSSPDLASEPTKRFIVDHLDFSSSFIGSSVHVRKLTWNTQWRYKSRVQIIRFRKRCSGHADDGFVFIRIVACDGHDIVVYLIHVNLKMDAHEEDHSSIQARRGLGVGHSAKSRTDSRFHGFENPVFVRARKWTDNARKLEQCFQKVNFFSETACFLQHCAFSSRIAHVNDALPTTKT